MSGGESWTGDQGRRTLGQISSAVSSAVGRRARPDGGASAQSRISGIEVIPEYLEVREQIGKGTPLILVTGGAGTGKSTFIRWLEEQYRGEILISAPTGIAALNIGGRTIHSLCQFPPAYIIPSDIHIRRKSPVRSAKVLVMDEISMVSANLLDSVNLFLQLNREDDKPFGGITVVLVGDLFQLPPIVTPETRPLFEAEYTSAKFFAARCVRNSEAYMVELTRAFRQTDQKSVDLLGNIREGKDVEHTLEVLNSICDITDAPAGGAVWLSPRHRDVDKVNLRRLGDLEGRSRTYRGTVTGEFPENNLPVPRSLTLKEGAQVVLVNNSADWVNGTVAIVVAMYDDCVNVRLVSSGETVRVPMETWKQSDYSINPDYGHIDRIEVGSYTQIPMILAWGMTIHKSQGMTLDPVHLDLGAGAFASGQTYVALSRCRTLLRTTLTRPVQPGDVRVDLEAVTFYEEMRRF